MSAVTIAALGAKEYAGEFGKKSTTSDVTFYHHISDERALTLVEPTQYPEKLAPLLVAVGLADRAMFVIPGLSREVAETATLLDLVDLPVDLFVQGAVGEEEVRRAFKGMRFESQPIRAFDAIHLRGELDGVTAPGGTGTPRIAIDHAFPVRGVGAVVLGVVRGGPVKAHEKLRLYPTDREVELRSIQVHDVDVPTAAPGDRVGLALKGIDAEELSRGQTLAPGGSMSAAPKLRGTSLRKCRYFKGTIDAKSHLHLSVGLQLVPVVVESVTGDAIVLESDRDVAYVPGETGILADLSPAAGPRIAARLSLA